VTWDHAYVGSSPTVPTNLMLDSTVALCARLITGRSWFDSKSSNQHAGVQGLDVTLPTLTAGVRFPLFRSNIHPPMDMRPWVF
jgi:hypothetical protein